VSSRQEYFWMILLAVGVSWFFAIALWLNWGTR
jgi:hypothetical protein